MKTKILDFLAATATAFLFVVIPFLIIFVFGG